MSTSRPDDENDEILGPLAKFERLLWRVIEGIGVFFFHRIPKWTVDLFRNGWEVVRQYFDRLIRVLVRLARITVLLGVLGLVVIGPGVALYYWQAPPWMVLTWAVLIIAALLFGVQRFVWKEYVRRRELRRAAVGVRLKCAYCHTVPRHTPPPNPCEFCGRAWTGVEV